MSKNFAGQNLNDRSFRGQDLSGADFSGCQLKSCDFRDTDLTGVRLCWATLGVDGWRMLAQWLATVVLIFISMFLTWFLNSLFISAVNEIYKYFTVPHAEVLVEENSTLIWIGSLYAASVCLSVLAALKYRGGADCDRVFFSYYNSGIGIGSGIDNEMGIGTSRVCGTGHDRHLFVAGLVFD